LYLLKEISEIRAITLLQGETFFIYYTCFLPSAFNKGFEYTIYYRKKVFTRKKNEK
jgi:hypothetical protein